jgi:hypothetical protein
LMIDSSAVGEGAGSTEQFLWRRESYSRNGGTLSSVAMAMWASIRPNSESEKSDRGHARTILERATMTLTASTVNTCWGVLKRIA